MSPAKNTLSHVRPIIVVPAFRRPAALKRLLAGLNRACYPADGVTLLISLDGESYESTRRVAESFRFHAGECTVRQHENRLGLRHHLLWCGDRSEEYGAVIVLEEDLMVAPDFYRYACAALKYYEENETIGGIALYGYEFNEFAGLPFVPLSDRHDAYFMATGCSSGQAWSHGQWSRFRKWMATADSEEIAGDPGLPAKLRNWPDSSWKKYYGAWLGRTGRFMVYPKQSLTTNCSDRGGSHVTQYFSDFQVNLPLEASETGADMAVPRAASTASSPEYQFPSAEPHPTEHAVCYDAFMEPCGSYIRRLVGIGNNIGTGSNTGAGIDNNSGSKYDKGSDNVTGSDDGGMPSKENGNNPGEIPLEVDLYGIKPQALLARAERCLTVRPSRNPEQRYPLHFRPLEHNMAYPVSNNTDGGIDPESSKQTRVEGGGIDPESGAQTRVTEGGIGREGDVRHRETGGGTGEGFFVLTRPGDITRYLVSGSTRYRLARYYMRGNPEKPGFLKGYLAACLRKLFKRIIGKTHRS